MSRDDNEDKKDLPFFLFDFVSLMSFITMGLNTTASISLISL